MAELKFSIVIIYKKADEFVLECVENCLRLYYSNFEILLLPDFDEPIPFRDSRIRLLPTGNIPIPSKRNFGIKHSSPETDCIAFIDSDAYPEEQWLANACKYFSDTTIAVVGGPNLTPSNDSLSRKICGFVYEQGIGFGGGAYRHKRSYSRFVAELPACNFIVRKSLFNTICFDDSFSAAEDNRLCWNISLLGYKILFAEDVVVMHHRRRIYIPLALQSYYYGYFRAKHMHAGRYFNMDVMLPMFLLIYLLFYLVLKVSFHPVQLVSVPLVVYTGACMVSSLWYTKNFLHTLLTSLAIAVCHLSYGFGMAMFFIDYGLGLMAGRNLKYGFEIPVNK